MGEPGGGCGNGGRRVRGTRREHDHGAAVDDVDVGCGVSGGRRGMRPRILADAEKSSDVGCTFPVINHSRRGRQVKTLLRVGAWLLNVLSMKG